ncbi:YbfB/YjiJ family MFS transporter [Geoalkalibacter halelectricus]|uniref:YbfB/YjiJ family MFS transporter n=1 Tax=Geoalkalibacter halelectricus TaxID=2847045 RepID=UPI003D254821
MEEKVKIRAVLLGGFVVLLIAMGVGRFAYTPLLPPMMEQYGFDADDAGLLASLNYLGYLVGAFAAGALCRVLGEGRLLVVGLALSVLSTAATGLFLSLSAVGLLRLVAGLASAFCFVAASGAVLNALAREGRDGLAGLFYGGVGFGIVLSGLLAVPLVEQFNATGAWVALGLLSALLLWPVRGLLHGSPVQPRRKKAAAKPPLPRGGRFYRLVAAYGLEGFGYIITGTFLVAAAGTVFEAAGAAGVWIVAGCAAIPSAFLWSQAARRFGALPSLIAAYFLQAIGIALPVFFPNPVGVTLGALLFGGTFMGIVGMALATGGSLLPAGRARVIGLMTGIYGIGQIIGPFLAGFMAARTGSFDLSLIVAATAVCAGGLLLLPDALRGASSSSSPAP